MALNTPSNEDVCWVFQWPFACMNDPESASKQIILQVFPWGYVFSYKFQGIFNSSVFSELTEHTESKMIIFTSGLLQSLRLSL